MTPEFAVRLINGWNNDPLMADTVRGRVIVAQKAEKGILVSWHEEKCLRLFVISDEEVLNSGWTDSLSDLLEILNKKENGA